LAPRRLGGAFSRPCRFSIILDTPTTIDRLLHPTQPGTFARRGVFVALPCIIAGSEFEDFLMSTYMPKPGEIHADWHLVDANNLVLGRLAARISIILQGKHKAVYSRNVQTGDFVIVLNADKIRVTGKKADVIEYDTYSRYPGGRHLYSYKTMNELHPERVLQLAVKRMLPKNKLGRHMLANLKIYTGTEHPHAAQQPKELKLAI
jgi:large subunit ribosomal protein L13